MSILQNSYHGNLEGGSEFTGVSYGQESNVSSVEVWTHIIDDDIEVLRALRVTWSDGADESWGIAEGDPTASANFEEDERITRMVINAGGWVDSIYFESSNQPDGVTLGGSGGDPHEQSVGNGRLKGFWGRSGDAIDALGTVFQHDE